VRPTTVPAPRRRRHKRTAPAFGLGWCAAAPAPHCAGIEHALDQRLDPPAAGLAPISRALITRVSLKTSRSPARAARQVGEAVVAIFARLVYLGMILGGLPRLQLDRTGVALLGAIAVVAGGDLTPPRRRRRSRGPPADASLLLFSFMVVSAQMRLGGFYAWVTRRVGCAAGRRRAALLAALIVVVAGSLSAVFSTTSSAWRWRRCSPTPACAAGLDPVPFLLGAGLRGQHRLGGDADRQPAEHADRLGAEAAFGAYLLEAARAGRARPGGALGAAGVAVAAAEAGAGADRRRPPRDRLPTTSRSTAGRPPRGWPSRLVLLVVFLFTDWPREVAALAGAGMLLMSRKLHSTHMMGWSTGSC
jgi:hypothetical protein